MAKVIEKILKKLTPERVKKLNNEVWKISVPRMFLKWVNEYNRVGEANRNDYFWKWLYRTAQTVTFPSIQRKYQKSIWNIKLLILLFVTLLDDPADKYQVRNKNLLGELLKVPFERNYIEFNRLSRQEQIYIKFTIKVWRYIEASVRKYPRYKQLKDIFQYDVRQLLNAMRYSYLINETPLIINEIEYLVYLPHNMQAFLSLDIDLMCSPEFDFQMLGSFREIAWNAQVMARIGNWVSTWEREIEERDFTSGIFAYAVNKNILTIYDLNNENKFNIVKKIKNSKIEERFFKEWEKCYWRIHKIGEVKRLPHIKKFLLSLETLINYHLSSRGYK